MMRRAAILVALAADFLLAACDSDDGGTTSTPGSGATGPAGANGESELR